MSKNNDLLASLFAQPALIKTNIPIKMDQLRHLMNKKYGSAYDEFLQ